MEMVEFIIKINIQISKIVVRNDLESLFENLKCIQNSQLCSKFDKNIQKDLNQNTKFQKFGLECLQGYQVYPIKSIFQTIL